MLDRLADAHDGGDPIARAEALSLAHHCLLGPDYARFRLTLADELLAASATTGRSLDPVLGLTWRTVDLFLVGDSHAERSYRELRERPEVGGLGCVRYVVAALDVMRAIRAGRLDHAERLAEEAYALGAEVGDADALGWYGAQLVTIRWMQGRGEELLPVVLELAESPTLAKTNDAYFAAVAALAAAAGRSDEANVALARLSSRGLAATRNSSGWMPMMMGVIEAAHLLGDGDTAREAYDLLAPHSHLPVMASLAIACFGSANRPLGLAALTFGDVERAVEHLEAAVTADLQFGHRPAHAISCAQLASALEQRGGPGDGERAHDLRRQAATPPSGSAWPPVPLPGWRRRGWRTSARVPPPRPALAGAARPPERDRRPQRRDGVPGPAPRRPRGGDRRRRAGERPAADGRTDASPCSTTARQAYRRRIEELQAEIDEADGHHDGERAVRARLELDRLVDELCRQTGLGGRGRSFGDESERARTSVQKAIKRALAIITEAEPIIGREMGPRLVTGARCVYGAGSAG